MATTALLATMRRAEFAGRTDKYAPPSTTSGNFINLDNAVRGIAPVDISGAVLSDRYVRDAASRLSSYSRFWNYYYGKHFSVEYDGGNKKTVYNFCRKISDKRANWIAGKGFSFISEKGNELVSEVIDNVWKANRKRSLVRRSSKMSLVTGDCFWYFTVKTKDRLGKLMPKDKWRVSIHPLNPSFVFPIWSEDDPSTIQAVLIQFPVWGSAGDKLTRIFTAYITPEKVEHYLDFELKSSEKNVLGMVPLVHIPNSPVGDGIFGRSCLEDIIPLNDSYNEIAGSVIKILRYHGEPTTIVYGAKLSSMERGANKVWSNLPPPGEAKVENLEMKGDLSASESHLKRVETQIYRHGKTPKISFDSEGLAISNTSGIAMQLMFQPLIEATIEEQDEYTEAIKKGNEIIASIHEKIFGENLSDLADEPGAFLDMEVHWESLLPKDEQTELDLAMKKVQTRIWSTAEAARRLSGVQDTEKLALELAADQIHEVSIAAEKAKALAQQKPNFSAAFLSSIFLSEDLLDIAEKIGEATENGDDGGDN